MTSSEIELPHEVDDHVGLFDRFANVTTRFVGRAPFFAGCVLLVALWIPSYWAIGDVERWQLAINTPTTIVTFLLVALLQNSEGRSNQATQHKLNAMATALADLMHEFGLVEDADELEAAVGLENRESTSR